MRTIYLMLLLALMAACTDDRATFEASSEDPVAIYDAAVEAALDDRDSEHLTLVFVDRLMDPEALNTYSDIDKSILRELVQRYPGSRLCAWDNCRVEQGELQILLSPLSRPTRDAASLYVIGYFDGEHGTLFDVQLERRADDWRATVSSQDMDSV